jgi:hypothetical protein
MSDRLLEELSSVDSQEFGEILETPREQGRLNNTQIIPYNLLKIRKFCPILQIHSQKMQ